MLSRTLASALAAFILSLPALADTLSTSPPEKVGLSTERLQSLTSALRGEVAKGRLPGAVFAIARKGHLAYFDALGYRDAVAKAPMARDAIFSIASMTKPMVSVAVMMLHDEGKLFLSDPVGKFLPQLAGMQVGVVKTDASGKETVEIVPAGRQPTIQDLLRHTSGFTYGAQGTTAVHKLWPASSSIASTIYTGPEFIEALSKTPLLYQPGTVWDYSLSTDVLGLIVEAISGKSLSVFLEERIWNPLGMVDTSFAVPAAKQTRYALAFPNDPLTNKPQTVLHASGKPLKFECGGACAVSTTTDYLRFAQMLLNGGVLDGQRIMSRKSVELMTTDQLAPDTRARSSHVLLPAGYGFGLGFIVRTHTGLSSVGGTAGEYGWGGAFGTSFWIDPKEQLAAVYMSAAPGAVYLHNHRLLVKNLVAQSIVD
jgi:CubicO group peptidase (beta-lactamase class C family)